MKSLLTIKTRTRKHTVPQQEKGLSLVISLLMGMVLTAGISGLLVRQLMARKLAASESYQQMAETSALNGFNRILSELNEDDSKAFVKKWWRWYENQRARSTTNDNGIDPNNPTKPI